jgi:hypothetical protein
VTRMAVLGILAGFAAGCASTWDTASSRAFQRDLVSNPVRALIVSDDPMTVLRTNPDGQARAKAIRRLEEPAAIGRDDEQAEAMQYLTEAATSDGSPVVRAAAIDALGRFRDPRAFQALAAAYAQASGTKSDGKPHRSADPNAPGLLAERSPLFGPSGFPPEVVTLLKSRALQAMARTGQPEAFAYLADVAGKSGDPKTMTAVDRDVRLAAVKALGSIRTPESARLLAQVMSAETNRDTAIANRAHEGLVELTGYSYPLGSPEWDGVMQAGFDVKPEANMIQRAFGWLVP